MWFLINFFQTQKFTIMKKIVYAFGLICVCLLIFVTCKGGGNSSDKKDYSNVEPVYIPCLTTSENAIIALSESLEEPTIQNTDKGCEITFLTAEGRQVFLVPWHFNLNEYAEDKAAGDDNLFFYDLKPLVVFEKGEKYYPYWQVNQSFSCGITLALPNGKFLSFLSLGTCSMTEQLADCRFRVQDRKFNTTKREINVKIINVNRFGNARHYISPIFHPVSSEQYSAPVEAKTLMSNNTIKGLYDAYRPADY